MKALKIKLLIVMLFAFGIATNLCAQRPEDEKLAPEKKAELMAAKMKEELKLTDAQVAKVKQIQTEHFRKAEKERNEAKTTREMNKANRDKLMEETDTELKKVLTEEQFKKYKEMREKRKERKEPGQDRRG